LGEKCRQLRQALRSGDWPEEICAAPKAISTLYLALLTYRLSAEELEALITRLKIPRDDAELLRQVSSLRPLEARLAAEDHPPSTVVHWLERQTLSALFVLWVATDSSRVRHQIERYCREWRFVHSEIDGQYLKALGLRPGPIFGRILRRLRDARLDGEIVSLEEEKAMVEQILAESDNNERGEQN